MLKLSFQSCLLHSMKIRRIIGIGMHRSHVHFLQIYLTCSRTIHGMVYNAMKLFMEINPRLFDDCSAEYTEHQNNASNREQSRQDKWKKLQEQADRRRNSTPSKSETDNLTQDSQKRLDALKLQDEASASKEASSVGPISFLSWSESTISFSVNPQPLRRIIWLLQ